MAELDKGYLKFNGYKINSMKLELLEKNKEKNDIIISPMFKRGIEDCGNDRYKVQLSLSIKSTEENPLPFDLSVIMTGDFELCMKEENNKLKNALLNDNTVAIMFPFLRSTIATLTTMANIEPLVLPVVNVTKVFNNED